MPSIYFNTVRRDDVYRAVTGLKVSDFQRLQEIFVKYYKPGQPNPYPNTPQPRLTDPGEALFFILHYLKAYPILQHQAVYFDLDICTTSKYLKITKAALKASLKELNLMPHGLFKNQAEFDKTFEGVEDLFVDCTEIPVERPQNYDNQKLIYSGKKKDIR